MNSSWPSRSKIPRSEIERASRHLFLCVGPDCCLPDDGARLWDVLKAETKALGIPVLRSKAACLRICQAGPWLVVYPDAIWYGAMDEERLRRVLREHVVAGQPVEEWIAARGPGCGQ